MSSRRGRRHPAPPAALAAGLPGPNSAANRPVIFPTVAIRLCRKEETEELTETCTTSLWSKTWTKVQKGPRPTLPTKVTLVLRAESRDFKRQLVVCVVIMEPCVPPGFRFHPTDEELVGYYLRKKVASQKIDLDVIRDVDLYRIEPWDLQEHCKIGYEEQSDWYFFSYKDRKYPTGTRTNRATLTGFWKATGRDKAVRHSKQGGGLIGMRKTLVFYTGRAPNGRKTDWIMHEYRLETDENAAPQEEGWVVCRAFKKRTMHPPRSVAGAWDPSYSYYHHDPILAGAARFKQESPEQLDGAAASTASGALLQYSSNIAAVAELPQLESPPLPNQGSSSHRAPVDGGEGDYSAAAAATDWRALDRFVASQLTPDEELATAGTGQQEYCSKLLGTHAGDGGEDATDMVALLLLDGALRHEEAGLLGSVADPAACLHKDAARCGGHQEQ